MEKKARSAVCFTIWFPEHNNPRYAYLFPKLEDEVRFYKLMLSRQRLIRAAQFCLWHRLKSSVYRLLLPQLARRYRVLFAVDLLQIPAWPYRSSVVVDVDDPRYIEMEVELLNLPQVKAIIVTTEKAKKIFQDMGVKRPIFIIPQGVDFSRLDWERAKRIGEQLKAPNELIVGYHAPTLTVSSDGRRRPRGGLDDLDFLFSAFEEAVQVEPRLRLWLLGRASKGVLERAKSMSFVRILGYVPFHDILNFVANFDIGVYPRVVQDFPPGRFSVKIAQMMACGIPIVSTRADEAFIIREAECGMVCGSKEEFVRALIELARSPELRLRLGKQGEAYARTYLDWNILVNRYKRILSEQLGFA
ncbi:MAG: glycosyltransferase [Candidatus Bathyarchaeia archaeon]